MQLPVARVRDLLRACHACCLRYAPLGENVCHRPEATTSDLMHCATAMSPICTQSNCSQLQAVRAGEHACWHPNASCTTLQAGSGTEPPFFCSPCKKKSGDSREPPPHHHGEHITHLIRHISCLANQLPVVLVERLHCIGQCRVCRVGMLHCRCRAATAARACCVHLAAGLFSQDTTLPAPQGALCWALHSAEKRLPDRGRIFGSCVQPRHAFTERSACL